MTLPIGRDLVVGGDDGEVCRVFRCSLLRRSRAQRWRRSCGRARIYCAWRSAAARHVKPRARSRPAARSRSRSSLVGGDAPSIAPRSTPPTPGRTAARRRRRPRAARPASERGDRAAAGHRLQRRRAEALVEAREHHRRRAAVERRQQPPRARGRGAARGPPTPQLARAPSSASEAPVGLAGEHQRERRGRAAAPAPRAAARGSCAATGSPGRRRSARAAPSGSSARRRARPASGVKRVEVDAQRHDLDPLGVDARARSTIRRARVLAGGDHHVGARAPRRRRPSAGKRARRGRRAAAGRGAGRRRSVTTVGSAAAGSAR